MICSACVYETPKRFTNPMTSAARVELCYSYVTLNQKDDVVGTDEVAERTP